MLWHDTDATAPYRAMGRPTVSPMRTKMQQDKPVGKNSKKSNGEGLAGMERIVVALPLFWSILGGV